MNLQPVRRAIGLIIGIRYNIERSEGYTITLPKTTVGRYDTGDLVVIAVETNKSGPVSGSVVSGVRKGTAPLVFHTTKQSGL